MWRSTSAIGVILVRQRLAKKGVRLCGSEHSPEAIPHTLHCTLLFHDSRQLAPPVSVGVQFDELLAHSRHVLHGDLGQPRVVQALADEAEEGLCETAAVAAAAAAVAVTR